MIEIPDAHIVVPGSFVTTDDGTGLVHLAPAFGADDMAASRAHGLPVVNPIRPDGHFEDGVPMVGGLFFKDADRRLIDDLDDRGLLFRSERHEHSYPHCWRCGTALIYYAVPSWFVKTTAIEGPAARAERADELVPRDGQARPVRRVAAEQRRLGAVADQVLGHPAAALGVRRVARDRRRVAGRAVVAGRART